MRSRFPLPPKFVVFTGPGLSREAGFAPFDPAAMPPRLSIEDVVTAEGFARDPDAVYGFYNLRRRALREAVPSLAHQGLAALDLARPGDLLVVTRNIDDLHERAGARAVIHTHGELLQARCRICTKVTDWFDDLGAADQCPVCGNFGHLRPHVVWVGEPPLRLDTVYAALAGCSVFASIGNAGGGEPGRSLLAAAARAGARTVEFAREPTANSADFAECVIGPLVETVPDWTKRLIAEG